MKKQCPVTNETLADYVYGEIEDASKKSEIEGHIKNCRECADETARLNLIKKAAKNADIDFSPDIWAVHSRGVLHKFARQENAFLKFKEAFFSAFDVKVLGLAALILLLTGVGLQYYKVFKVIQDRKAMAEQMELLQNFEIIERLDFYEKISKK